MASTSRGQDSDDSEEFQPAPFRFRQGSPQAHGEGGSRQAPIRRAVPVHVGQLPRQAAPAVGQLGDPALGAAAVAAVGQLGDPALGGARVINS